MMVNHPIIPLVHPEERATVLTPRQAQGTAHAAPQQGAGRLSEALRGLGARGSRWGLGSQAMTHGDPQLMAGL